VYVPKFDTLSIRFVGRIGRFNPHWLKMTATLVKENFCLGGRLRPPPVPIQQDQHNVQMISKYRIIMVKDRITVC